jgi:hypothetical protein
MRLNQHGLHESENERRRQEYFCLLRMRASSSSEMCSAPAISRVAFVERDALHFFLLGLACCLLFVPPFPLDTGAIHLRQKATGTAARCRTASSLDANPLDYGEEYWAPVHTVPSGVSVSKAI